MERKTIQALLIFSFSLLLLLILSPVAGADDIYDSVIRIHVLANSDSPEDQELKLEVRDALLQYARENLSSCNDREEAKEEIAGHVTQMEKIGKSVLERQGISAPLSISLTEEYYPTRTYDTLSLPQGKYLSLKVEIGAAQGKNWWCILFPPLCLDSAKGAADALLEAGMEEENVKTVTLQNETYQIRFRILEIWEKAKKSVSDCFS